MSAMKIRAAKLRSVQLTAIGIWNPLAGLTSAANAIAVAAKAFRSAAM